jgi:hypothetical protein
MTFFAIKKSTFAGEKWKIFKSGEMRILHGHIPGLLFSFKNENTDLVSTVP